jgi:crossover junction endodeoxyribonuclease RusA
MIHVTLPFPPSVNTYWRMVQVNGKPRMLISARGRAYAATVARWVQDQAPGLRFTHFERLGLHMTVHAPDKRARDLDNLLKASLDALQKAGVFESDSQIDRLFIERGSPQPPTGRIEVTLDILADDWRSM